MTVLNLKWSIIPLTLNLQFLGKRKQMNNLKVLLRDFRRRTVSPKKSALLSNLSWKTQTKLWVEKFPSKKKLTTVSRINFKLCFNCNWTLLCQQPRRNFDFIEINWIQHKASLGFEKFSKRNENLRQLAQNSRKVAMKLDKNLKSYQKIESEREWK